MTGSAINLRRLTYDDLDLITRWLEDPDVTRWFLTGSSLEAELADLARCIVGDEATEVLLASCNGRPIGWCQWYLCRDYPDHAASVGAGPEDAGIDYAIGDPADRGRRLGTALIHALVSHIQRRHPRAGIIADPEATNLASRAVLERNGFILIDERPLPSEPTDAIMAIYRRPPETS